MILARNLTFYHGSDLIFDGASFSVAKGRKVGLVGPNGAGKTTLLNILAGREIPDGGKVEVIGSFGFVPQEVKTDLILENSQTVRKYLDSQNSRKDYQLRKMLDGLELENITLEQKPRNLSGGQRTKLALARALLSEPDVLFLDEPTNFMDIAGKKWVMNFLGKYPKTLILISHDLVLLDKYVDKIMAIDIHSKKIEEYTGNYSKFMKFQKEKEELLRRRVVAEQRHIKRMEKGLTKLYKHSSGKGVRQRVMLQRRIKRAKEKLPELPQEVKMARATLPPPAWVGELPIWIKGVSKAYRGKQALSGVNLSIKRGERITLIGRNGVGKSTLIKIIVGISEPDLGEVIRDEKLKLGYYSQELENFDLEKTVVETVQEQYPVHEGKIRPFLTKFLFSGDRIYQKVGTLSGGEKTRLAIALLVLHDYNLLILDEPTTYLDLISQRVILEALKEYQGAMLVVSHTEDFIRELNPSRALLLPENEIKIWTPELLEKVGEV